MIPVRRLLKRSDFLALKGQGKRVFKSSFVLQWQKDEAEPGIAVGYTASTKGVGNAVQRNRARRRLKAVMDELVRLNPRANGGQRRMALIAKESVLTVPYTQLCDDMMAALQEAGITTGQPQ